MKKYICIFISMLFLLSCSQSKPADTNSTTGKADDKTASANTAKPGEKIKFGFFVKQPEESWFITEWAGSKQAAQDLGLDTIQIGTPEGEKVLTAIDTIAAQGAKGLIICTPDVKLGPAIMEKAKSYNLKVIAIDDRFIKDDNTPMEEIPYIGMSASEIGAQVGEELYKEMQKRGWDPKETAALELTFESLQTAKERTNGAHQKLVASGFDESKIYKVAHKFPDQENALNATNTLIPQHPEVKHWLAFAMNDGTILGAVRAFEQAGYKADDVIAIGINGQGFARDELKKTEPTGFYGSIMVNAFDQAYNATKMLKDWIETGVEPAKNTYSKGILITRDNFKEEMTKAHTWVD